MEFLRQNMPERFIDKDGTNETFRNFYKRYTKNIKDSVDYLDKEL